jgi:DNA-binding transcriptional regulator YiaG
MDTLPIFIVHIQVSRGCLGRYEKFVKGYSEIPTTLGEHLRKRRLDLRETQQKASTRFAISVTTYNYWEADRVKPDIAQSPKIIGYLGYDPYPAPTNFEESVRALRRNLGLNRRQFAKQLGVDVKSVLNWEMARTVPFQKKRARLAVLGSGLPHLAV